MSPCVRELDAKSLSVGLAWKAEEAKQAKETEATKHGLVTGFQPKQPQQTKQPKVAQVAHAHASALLSLRIMPQCVRDAIPHIARAGETV